MRSFICSLLLIITFATISVAQNPRVYITDSKSWQISGGFGGTDEGFGGASSGGARPQTAEIIKTFGQRCPEVTVNNIREKADYVVLLDHEGGKAVFLRDNKVAVFNRNGDSILSQSTRVLGNAVQDACAAIEKDWSANAAKYRSAEREQSDPAPNTAPGAAAPEMHDRVTITSTPAGADIEVDGKFVGNTPSSLHLTAGDHTITIKKAGFKDWTRTMTVTDGDITLSPELEKVQ